MYDFIYKIRCLICKLKGHIWIEYHSDFEDKKVCSRCGKVEKIYHG